jgi:hypothetical protein
MSVGAETGVVVFDLGLTEGAGGVGVDGRETVTPASVSERISGENRTKLLSCSSRMWSVVLIEQRAVLASSRTVCVTAVCPAQSPSTTRHCSPGFGGICDRSE